MSELINESKDIASTTDAPSPVADDSTGNTGGYGGGGHHGGHHHRDGHHNSGSPMIPNAVLFNRTASVVFRRPSCPLSGKDAPVLDYKNIELLKKYTSEKGKIIPSRITEVCRKKQSELMKCIKRARELALLPFSAS